MQSGELTTSVKAVTKNPLGIIALFIFLIYSIASLVLGVSAEILTEGQKWVFVVFLVVFPLLVLGSFVWLVANHAVKLYSPADFRNDWSYVKLNQKVEVIEVKQEAAQVDPRGSIEEARVRLKELMTFDQVNAAKSVAKAFLKVKRYSDSLTLFEEIGTYLKNKGKHEGTYIRIGTVNRLASEDALIALERAGRKISFDEVAVYEIEPQDLNLKEFINDYEKTTGKNLDDEKLRNLGLFIAEHGTLHPANAAILLSNSPERKRLFPYAKVECARFKGTETSIFLDQVTIDGPIHTTIEPCISFVKRNIALGSKIGEVYREDRWEYPLEAVREAIINAVIHRDYAIRGSDIKVAIFDDMLEITSPGALPDTISIDTLGTGRSEIRNRVLAPIFKELKLIEAWGTGIQKMKREIKKYPGIELVLKETGQAFQVQFKKEVTTEVTTEVTMEVEIGRASCRERV